MDMGCIYMEPPGDFQDPAPLTLKSSNFLYCCACDYTARRKWNYKKHCLTAKHKKNYNDYKLHLKLLQSSKMYECPHCDKLFKSKSGKNKHRRKCPQNKIKLLKKQLENQSKELKLLKETKIENKYLKKHVEVLKQNKGTIQNNCINMKILNLFLIKLIKFYKFFLSPLFGQNWGGVKVEILI